MTLALVPVFVALGAFLVAALIGPFVRRRTA